MRALKGHSKYTPPSSGKSNLDTLKKLTCVHVIQTVLASERSERDTLRSVQLRIVDIYIYYSTCNMCKFCSYNP